MTTIGYIGSYTKKEGKGIYRFELDEAKGQITTAETGYEIEASTYLVQYNSYLYAITREGDDCGVASFEIGDKGKLTLINKCLESTAGTGCYVSVSPDGQFLFESVYGAGLARIYELDTTSGKVVKLIQELQHTYPVGPNERQEHPHIHLLDTTPDNYVVAMDLGSDRVVTYQYGQQGLTEYAVTQFEPGDGPRHITFNGNNKYAYIVHELSNIVSVVSYHDGKFKEVERHSTIPDDFTGDTKLAGVRLSQDQQFLYISNRGHDSIAIFKVANDGSSLELINITHSGGEFPRDFNISNSDDYLVCAHQEGDYALTLFTRDKNTGELTQIDNHAEAAEGVCVKFLQ
ncbi:6-phosphogluconolactonase [Staphylococcus durrellii]|uniref:6-phosphogluconolactonase n=1 Tax=Staphylococcus durrellii TaxID=2781773 RepID=UPI00189C7EB8|nr:beta-propeller fold lactonase family protein [Staphylococcus durrellii]MBF7016661.1 beta-propeller fold lactonase family protein [Staphylococcus durrellii]